MAEQVEDSPLFRVAGMFEMNEPGWADRHQEMRDPEVFEHPTLETLHQTFLRATHIMAEIGTRGKNYWDILHAAESLLKAMGEIENAAFEWRSYDERLDEEDA